MHILALNEFDPEFRILTTMREAMNTYKKLGVIDVAKFAMRLAPLAQCFPADGQCREQLSAALIELSRRVREADENYLTLLLQPFQRILALHGSTLKHGLCPMKVELLRLSQNASMAYVLAAAHLQAKSHASTSLEYALLKEQAETSLHDSDRARFLLDSHTQEHGC